MALRIVSTRPQATDYVSFAEHQGQTPDSFHSTRAVLYYHSPNVEVVIAQDELNSHPAITALASSNSNNATPNGRTSNTRAVLTGIDLWVNSENFILFNTSSSAGVSIPYPSIALHALQTLPNDDVPAPDKEALLMHLSLNDTSLANAEEDYEMMEMSIIPPPSDPNTAAEGIPEQDGPSTSARGGSNSRTPARLLFNAVSACADLHPDPQTDDEEEDDTAPGAGGWITAENADQYFDEDGQFVGQQILGPGAGTVRSRGEDDDAPAGEELNEENAGADGDAKWRRTS